MEGEKDNNNLEAMEKLVALSEERTRLALKRTQMAEEQSRMSKERSRMSAERSKMSNDRTLLSATRSYMNAERTLSVWVRTALSSMIFGIAIDRWGLMVTGKSMHPNTLFGHPSTSTTLTGAVLVLFSVVMSLTAVSRFIGFSRHYKKDFPLPYHHKTWLPATYAFMVAFFGAILFFVMWWVK